ncbi:MAG: ACT domain-containing protein [Halothermotrichaceae bacterium]
MKSLTLILLQEKFAVCRQDNKLPIPMWVLKSRDFYSITRTHDEMSIVCIQASLPAGVEAEEDWRTFKVEGPLDFSMTGVISSLTDPLAKNEISVFVISTYETDYIMVKEEDIEKAVQILEEYCTVKRT